MSKLLWPLGAALALTALVHSAEPKVGQVELTEKAKQIHAGCLVFDGQNGLCGQLRRRGDLHLEKHDLRAAQQELRTDIPRLRQGGVGAQFFSVYVDPAAVKNGKAAKETLEQIDLIHRLVAKYPDVFELAYSANDVSRIRQEGKIAALIGVEGGHSIENSLSVLRSYHKMGVRFLTLTNSDNCEWADAHSDKPKHFGLSKFGEEVIAEMNRLGILIDLAHASPETMQHALLVSRAPVMFSHTACQALAPHPRNVSDDVLRLVAKNNGIVMINFYTGFLTAEGVKAYQERSKAAHQLRAKYTNDKQYDLALRQLLKDKPLPAAGVAAVVDHIDHIVKVAGIDHVGLGSNFDGMGTAPKQLEDVASFPYITQELLNRGYTTEQIQKILGGNMLRVLRQAGATAERVSR